MTKLTKIERFFKETNFSADDELFVGVDVHKKSYHVALYLNDAPSIDFVMPAKKEQLSQTLKPTQPALRQVAYEAGFSGRANGEMPFKEKVGSLWKNCFDFLLFIKIICRPSRTSSYNVYDPKLVNIIERMAHDYVNKDRTVFQRNKLFCRR